MPYPRLIPRSFLRVCEIINYIFRIGLVREVADAYRNVLGDC